MATWKRIITATDTIAVGYGGTGAQDISTARSNLGVEIGVDVQAYDADLAAYAGLTPSDGGFIVGTGTSAGNWTVESGVTARASLGVSIGTNVQGYSSYLNTISGLVRTDGNFMVANGTTWTSVNASSVRSELNVADGADVGTVTSVGTSGTVSGITLTGTVTGSGTLTLGGSIGIDDLDNVTVSDAAASGGSPSTGDIWIEY
jgi:hypothetical protein